MHLLVPMETKQLKKNVTKIFIFWNRNTDTSIKRNDLINLTVYPLNVGTTKRILSFHAFDKIQYKLKLFSKLWKEFSSPFWKKNKILKKFHRHLPNEVDLSVNRLQEIPVFI